MDEKQYSNRELDQKFTGLQEVMEAHLEAINENLVEVVTQTKKTNGSVANLKVWRGYMAGFCACLALIVVPSLGYLAIQLLQNTTNIATIEAEIYEIQK